VALATFFYTPLANHTRKCKHETVAPHPTYPPHICARASRLHFAVPGASDGSSDNSGGGGGGGRGGRVKFPSRRKQFLDFVDLSEWLLRQLGGVDAGDADGSTSGTSSSDTPTAVCAKLLGDCQVC